MLNILSLLTILLSSLLNISKAFDDNQIANEKGCTFESIGYNCCSSTTDVIYQDENGDWGVENNDWCGIIPSLNDKSKVNCFSEKLGYPCCIGCNVIYTDDDGDWGIEQGSWCGINDKCTTITRTTSILRKTVTQVNTSTATKAVTPGIPQKNVPADTKNSWNVYSPNQKTFITFELDNGNGSLFYLVKQDDKDLVERSPLGIKTNLGDFTNGLNFKEVHVKIVNEKYPTYSGKKDEYVNHYVEKTIIFNSSRNSNVDFGIVARSYNDGVAFRYIIITGDHKELTIEPNDEVTGIKLPDDATVWEMSYNYEEFMYEEEFEEKTINDIGRNVKPTMPMLFRTGDDKYGLVTEAVKVGTYVGSHLEVDYDHVLRFKFDDHQRSAVKTQTPFQSPWRAFVVGGLDEIMENTMVENLSPEPDNAQYDFASWVAPGVSSWSWVAHWGYGESDQSNPNTHKKWIDLASTMGWRFYILDEGWQPDSYDNDGSYYSGWFDWWPEVRDYAKRKGVQLIAWVHKNDVDTPEKRRKRFKEWSEEGIVGIKVDFFFNEAQSTLQLHQDIYKEAARYHLLVNVHGSNPPSGEIRTYPNVLAREGIRGQEAGGITAYQYTILPFTRGAIGTTDVTEELRSKDPEVTTMGFQIALSTLFENGIHSLGSAPDVYYSNTEGSDYYKDFPARWDGLKLINGEVGRYYNLARRTGDRWFAAGVSVEARDMKWKPTFLDSNKKYTATLYRERGNNRQALEIVTLKNVTPNTELNIHVMNGGGYAIKFTP